LTVCLDSWAVLAWLDGEQPAHDRIEQLLDDRPLMSWVNAVEVYYRVQRDHGRSEADDVLAGLRQAFELDLPGPADDRDSPPEGEHPGRAWRLLRDRYRLCSQPDAPHR
jgi:hypothetical protein